MRGRLVLLASAFVLGSGASGSKAPDSMREFNVNCPFASTQRHLEASSRKCGDRDPGACRDFVEAFRLLTVVSDCQRPFDTSPRGNHIVPAIWLAGDENLDRYIELLRGLHLSGRFPEATALFASKEFRGVLDGYFAEVYLQESLDLERRLLGALPPSQPLHPTPAAPEGSASGAGERRR